MLYQQHKRTSMPSIEVATTTATAPAPATATTTTTTAPVHAPATHRANVAPRAVQHPDQAQIKTPRLIRTTVGCTTSTATMPTTASLRALIQEAALCNNNSSSRETDAGGAGDFLGHPPNKPSRGSPTCYGLRLEEEVARRWRGLCLSHPPNTISTHHGPRRNPSASSQWY